MRFKIEYRDESTWDAMQENHSGEEIEFELPALVGLRVAWTYGCGLLFENQWMKDDSAHITLFSQERADAPWEIEKQEGGVVIPND